MKKLIIYSVFALIILGLLYYLAGESGLIGGLFGIGGYTGSKAMRKLREQGETFDKQAEEKTKELREIQAKKDNLEVKDLSPEDEKEYWKDV